MDNRKTNFEFVRNQMKINANKTINKTETKFNTNPTEAI